MYNVIKKCTAEICVCERKQMEEKGGHCTSSPSNMAIPHTLLWSGDKLVPDDR